MPLAFRPRGGARRGAGRPPKGNRAGVSHGRRPRIGRHHPVHVTMRVQAGVPSLRAPRLFVCVRGALAAGKVASGFRLVHFSVQSNHLHLIVEADERESLSRGMQGLSVRIARRVNGVLSRSGRLLADRYHARSLTTPRAVYFALRYVLLNSRKHERSAVPAGFLDPCSSAPWFEGFERPSALAFGARRARADWQRRSESNEPPVAAARCWLLRIGYQRAGPFDSDDAPRAP